MRQNKGTTTPPVQEDEACTALLGGSTDPPACILTMLRQMIGWGGAAILDLPIPTGCCHEEQNGGAGFMGGEEGASMAEYAILLAVITAALVSILSAYTRSIADVFNYVSSVLTAVTAGGS